MKSIQTCGFILIVVFLNLNTNKIQALTTFKDNDNNNYNNENLSHSTHSLFSSETNTTPPTSHLMVHQQKQRGENDDDNENNLFDSSSFDIEVVTDKIINFDDREFSDVPASTQTKIESNLNNMTTLAFNDAEQVNLSDSSYLTSSHETMTLEANSKEVKWIHLSDMAELVDYVSTQELKSEIDVNNGNNGILIIDTRNSNEYNGWKSFTPTTSSSTSSSTTPSPFNNNMGAGLLNLYDTKNGHILNAHNLDADWLHLFDAQIVNAFIRDRFGLTLKNTTLEEEAEKGVIPIIVLYDTCKIRLGKVRRYLEDTFNTDSIYMCQLDNDQISAYILTSSSSSSLLSSKNETSTKKGNGIFFQEPFFDMLLSPDSLNFILNASNKIEYKLFEVSNREAYDVAHISTAVHVNINELLVLDNSDDNVNERKSKSALAEVLLEWGIMPNNTEFIILYGNPDSSGEAYRAALIIKWMGVKNVHILNGGFRSWTLYKDGLLPIESYSNKRPTLNFEINNNGNNKQSIINQYEEQSLAAQATPITYIVDYSYVNDIVQNYDVFSPHYTLIDVRSYAQHIRGRIPTSLWGRSTQDYLNPDGTMRSGVEILAMWDELGIDYKRKHLIFYSNDNNDDGNESGAEAAAEIIFYAELMGLYKISVYEGGWREWSRMANNTFQMGPSTDSESISFFETQPSTHEDFLQTITTSVATSSKNRVKITKPIISTLTSTTTSTNNLNSSASTISKVVITTSPKRNTTTKTNSFFKEQFDRVTAITPLNNGIRLNISLLIYSFSLTTLAIFFSLF